jgi:hypothetical protein
MDVGLKYEVDTSIPLDRDTILGWVSNQLRAE